MRIQTSTGLLVSKIIYEIVSDIINKESIERLEKECLLAKEEWTDTFVKRAGY